MLLRTLVMKTLNHILWTLSWQPASALSQALLFSCSFLSEYLLVQQPPLCCQPARLPLSPPTILHYYATRTHHHCLFAPSLNTPRLTTTAKTHPSPAIFQYKQTNFLLAEPITHSPHCPCLLQVSLIINIDEKMRDTPQRRCIYLEMIKATDNIIYGS